MSARPMRALPVVVLIGACTSAPSFTEDDRRAVAVEVRATLNDLTSAINAHDEARVLEFYTDAPEFLFVGCTNAIVGGATFKQMVGPTYRPATGATFVQRVAAVQALSPTSAVAYQVGNSSSAPALFWSRVLVKEAGRWIITYEHQSWPGCESPAAPHPYSEPSDSAGLRPGGPAN